MVVFFYSHLASKPESNYSYHGQETMVTDRINGRLFTCPTSSTSASSVPVQPKCRGRHTCCRLDIRKRCPAPFVLSATMVCRAWVARLLNFQSTEVTLEWMLHYFEATAEMCTAQGEVPGLANLGEFRQRESTNLGPCWQQGGASLSDCTSLDLPVQ